MGPTAGVHVYPGAPTHCRAVHPVYTGCCQVLPESNEKYTPETPTPAVNGQVVGSPALQSSTSISSFEPATRMFGWLASTAIAGSFCLLCENGEDGLPVFTSDSVVVAPSAVVAVMSANRTATGIAETFVILFPPTTRRR